MNNNYEKLLEVEDDSAALGSNEDDCYYTKDLGIAAYLYATKKVELVKIKRQPEKKICFFYFSPYDIAFQLAREYINEKAGLIQPRQYYYALKYVKDAIYSSI